MPPNLNEKRESHFFTPKEAATYLGVHINSIWKWIKKPADKGGITAKKLGSKKHPVYRIPKDKFIQWANGEEK
ncbi:MAG: helix-turn-helix domain-containing protein [Patescibacteria group bacterium]|nr:helix-turn-helix domain-containing protein [Patescibacteria group bacterium]